MSNDKMENTASKKKLLSTIGTVFFAVVSLFYVAPIVVVFVNSLKILFISPIKSFNSK